MKYAVICPPEDAGALALWYRGYQFALGQELVRDDRYASIMRLAHRQGAFIIVDNGAAENEVMSFESIVWAANQVNADEIIMPDVLRNGDETFKLTTDPKTLELVEPRRRMIVPQGNSWDEWKECMRNLELQLRGQYASIGLAKHLERLPQGRARAARILQGMDLPDFHHIHMLGIWHDPYLEIMRVRQVIPRVRGIDSGLAIACAQNNKTVTPQGHYSLGWHQTEHLELAQRNIASIDAICHS